MSSGSKSSRNAPRRGGSHNDNSKPSHNQASHQRQSSNIHTNNNNHSNNSNANSSEPSDQHRNGARGGHSNAHKPISRGGKDPQRPLPSPSLPFVRAEIDCWTDPQSLLNRLERTLFAVRQLARQQQQQQQPREAESNSSAPKKVPPTTLAGITRDHHHSPPDTLSEGAAATSHSNNNSQHHTQRPPLSGSSSLPPTSSLSVVEEPPLPTKLLPRDQASWEEVFGLVVADAQHRFAEELKFSEQQLREISSSAFDAAYVEALRTHFVSLIQPYVPTVAYVRALQLQAQQQLQQQQQQQGNNANTPQQQPPLPQSLVSMPYQNALLHLQESIHALSSAIFDSPPLEAVVNIGTNGVVFAVPDDEQTQSESANLGSGLAAKTALLPSVGLRALALLGSDTTLDPALQKAAMDDLLARIHRGLTSTLVAEAQQLQHQHQRQKSRTAFAAAARLLAHIIRGELVPLATAATTLKELLQRRVDESKLLEKSAATNGSKDTQKEDATSNNGASASPSTASTSQKDPQAALAVQQQQLQRQGLLHSAGVAVLGCLADTLPLPSSAMAPSTPASGNNNFSSLNGGGAKTSRSRTDSGHKAAATNSISNGKRTNSNNLSEEKQNQRMQQLVSDTSEESEHLLPPISDDAKPSLFQLTAVPKQKGLRTEGVRLRALLSAMRPLRRLLIANVLPSKTQLAYDVNFIIHRFRWWRRAEGTTSGGGGGGDGAESSSDDDGNDSGSNAALVDSSSSAASPNPSRRPQAQLLRVARWSASDAESPSPPPPPIRSIAYCPGSDTLVSSDGVSNILTVWAAAAASPAPPSSSSHDERPKARDYRFALENVATGEGIGCIDAFAKGSMVAVACRKRKASASSPSCSIAMVDLGSVVDVAQSPRQTTVVARSFVDLAEDAATDSPLLAVTSLKSVALRSTSLCAAVSAAPSQLSRQHQQQRPGTLLLFNATAETVTRRTPNAHADAVTCLATSQESEHLVYSGSRDGVVKLWDLRSGSGGSQQQQGATATVFGGAPSSAGWADAVSAIAAARDLLAVGSLDRTFRLFDTRRLSQPLATASFDSPVLKVATSPQGGLLFVATSAALVTLTAVPLEIQDYLLLNSNTANDREEAATAAANHNSNSPLATSSASTALPLEGSGNDSQLQSLRRRRRECYHDLRFVGGSSGGAGRCALFAAGERACVDVYHVRANEF